jgi:hypothetical protein
LTATRKAQLDCLLLRRRIARFERERQQLDLISSATLFKSSIEAKLIGLGAGPQFDNFMRCGHEEIYCTCSGCGAVEKFFYSCNRKWCPRCVVKLTALRIQKVRLWASKIDQPKHLVLTMRNFQVLTGRKIREFQKALTRLRRLDCWKQVKGGCCSIEITNSGEGWHLHAHLLLDVRWLNMEEISVEWGKQVNQEFGIVKIKDVRGSEYVNEVAKYVAKGSEIAKWDGNQIWEFTQAIKGKRFFFAFGSLFKMGKAIKTEINQANNHEKLCKCGCGKFVYQTEADMVLDEIRAAKGDHRRRRR